ncbi:MAG: LysR family transcriptional regulator, partial [Boseongicola sp.]|nr:LysR family transcriptional regulator [Boseongicola sp.]
ILDSNLRNSKRWLLKKDGEDVIIEVDGGFLVNSARAACALAVASRGISFSPMFAISEHLRTGDLVTLLDGYEGNPSPVSAVYLEGRRLPKKVRALIDFASEDIKSADVY